MLSETEVSRCGEQKAPIARGAVRCRVRLAVRAGVYLVAGVRATRAVKVVVQASVWAVVSRLVKDLVVPGVRALAPAGLRGDVGKCRRLIAISSLKSILWHRQNF